MKKLIVKIFVSTIALVLCVACAFGCGGTDWKGKVTLTDGGEAVAQHGFLTETEKYVYFINGSGVASEDNSFGKPIKGSLMVADKSDLTKCEIVVPKLLVSTDYNAGFYIIGDYVYYGTPSTKKDSSGKVANDFLEIARTKLDGTGSEELVTVSGLNSQFRVIENGDNVYVVYYDSEDSSIKCLDVAAKKTVTVAENPAAYMFADNAGADGFAVAYTVTCYKAYDADKEEGETKTEDVFNKVYAFKAGESESKLILDGTGTYIKASLTRMEGEYVYYTAVNSVETNESLKTIIYYNTTENFYAKTELNTNKIIASALVADTTLFVSPEEVYVIDSGYILKTTLLGNADAHKVALAKADASKLLFIEGNYMYYYNSANNIARIDITDDEAEEFRVSADTVNTAWYAPAIVGENIFYIDNSASGASYIHYIDIGNNATIVEKDTDDDDTIDSRYLDGQKLIGTMTDADVVAIVTSEINALSSSLTDGKIVFDKDDEGNVKLTDGQPTVDAIIQARASYEALNETQKKLVTKDVLDSLSLYEEGLRVCLVIYKLDGFDMLSKTQKTELEGAYEAAESRLENLNADTAEQIKAMIYANGMWYFQQAEEFFTEA